MSFIPHRNSVYYNHDDVKQETFQVEPGSLVVFEDQAYTEYLHGIDNVTKATRVSLTIRHVYPG